MIWTSYFSNIKNLPSNFIPVSICLKPPAGYKGLQYNLLAPKSGIFSEWKGSHDDYLYVRNYREQVTGRLKAKLVVEALQRLTNSNGSDGKEICLMCFEKPEDFCHRHLAAEWLTENGYPCKEWANEIKSDKLP